VPVKIVCQKNFQIGLLKNIFSVNIKQAKTAGLEKLEQRNFGRISAEVWHNIHV